MLAEKADCANMKVLGDERGQGLIEYALIISLVSVALIAGLTALKGGIKGSYDAIVATL